MSFGSKTGVRFLHIFVFFHFSSKIIKNLKKSIFWGLWDFPDRHSHVTRGHPDDLITGPRKSDKSFHYFLIKKWQKIMKKWQKVTKSDKVRSGDVGVWGLGPRSCWASQILRNHQNLRDPSKTLIWVFDHFLSGFLKSIWASYVLFKKYQFFIDFYRFLMIFWHFSLFTRIGPQKTIRSSTQAARIFIFEDFDQKLIKKCQKFHRTSKNRVSKKSGIFKKVPTKAADKK